MRTYVRMIVCVHMPRLELRVAAGERSSAVRQALAGRALAVAPLPGGEQRVGEVSGAAEAVGVVRGMLLGEAIARAPDLILVPADPVKVAEVWEAHVRALEAVGAAVEPARAGLAYFAADPLRGLYGGEQATIAAARRALELPVRIGAGPTRFCSLAAALAARSRRPLVLQGSDARRWLAGRPVGLLGFRARTEELLEPLARLGVHTLGELARLPRAALADRFGEAGVLAHRLACGEDEPLRPRRVQERLEERLDVGDASSGPALERVLGVLVERLLARRERRGRTLRAVTLSARLLPGGGWRERVPFRQATSDPQRIRLALAARLTLLPAPAATLGLSVERFGPAAGEQRSLLDQGRSERSARLGEAVAQVRAAAGADAALRAVCVDPDSRVPERRVMLAPFPDR
jgi:protein ImuB